MYMYVVSVAKYNYNLVFVLIMKSLASSEKCVSHVWALKIKLLWEFSYENIIANIRIQLIESTTLEIDFFSRCFKIVKLNLEENDNTHNTT